MSHSIDISEQGGVRHLHFGSSWVQGAMRLSRPWALELAYTRDMMAGLLWQPSPPWPNTVLIIGLGAASQVRFIHKHLPHSRMTAVEINPGVVAAARQFFKLDEASARLHIEIADAADFLATDRACYDLILLDAFDAEGRTGALGNVDFLHLCRERLTENGILSVNLLTREKSYPKLVTALQTTFPDQIGFLPRCSSGNAVALAGSGLQDIEREDLLQRSDALKNATGLDFSDLIERIAQALPPTKAVVSLQSLMP